MSKVLGPIRLDAQISFIDPETGNVATVNYGFPPGQPVSAEDIEAAMRACAEAVAKTGPYVLMGPNTFFNHVIVKAKTGRIGMFALPASFRYDAFGMEIAEADWHEYEDEEDFDDEDEDDA